LGERRNGERPLLSLLFSFDEATVSLETRGLWQGGLSPSGKNVCEAVVTLACRALVGRLTVVRRGREFVGDLLCGREGDGRIDRARYP
jgi:hypothetical protein